MSPEIARSRREKMLVLRTRPGGPKVPHDPLPRNPQRRWKTFAAPPQVSSPSPAPGMPSYGIPWVPLPAKPVAAFALSLLGRVPIEMGACSS
jgi:hypothetical protein